MKHRASFPDRIDAPGCGEKRRYF